MSVISRPVPPMPSPDVLERRGIPVHDRRVTVDGLSTQYLEAGTGPPVLRLHGHEQSPTSWRWVIPALARTHRVLALSLPGHGETDPAVVGGLLGYAALTFDAEQATGLDGAMRLIVEQPFGRFLLTAVAVGFAAFGVFAFLQARYRRM